MACAVARVAIRGARARLPRVVMTLAGIAVSVAFVASVQITTASMQSSFDRSFTEAFGSADLVVRARYGPTNSFVAMLTGEQALVDESLVDKISGVDGVRIATGQVQAPITIIGPDGRPWRPPATPGAVGLNWIGEGPASRWTIISGRPPVADDEVVVDRHTADLLSLAPGDSLSVVGTAGTEHRLRVAAIGSHGETGTFAGMPVVAARTPAAQAMFLQPGKVNWISVEGAAGVEQGTLRQRVASVLPHDAKSVTGERFARDARALIAPLVQLIERFLLAFAYVALLVSCYVIYNTFSIVVAQRRKELALLRAVGASRWQLMLSVLVEAALVGLASSVLGAVLGLAAAHALRAALVHFGVVLAGAPLHVPVAPVSVAVMLGFWATILAAVVPGWRASRARTVATLRSVESDEVSRPRARALFSLGMIAYGVVNAGRGLTGEGPDRMAWVAAGVAACFLGVAASGPLLLRFGVGMLRRPVALVGGATGRLAGLNASRQPVRAARVASSLLVSVGLMTMFAVMTTSMAGATRANLHRAVRADIVVRPYAGPGAVISDEALQAIRSTEGVGAVTGLRFGAAEVDDLPATAVGIDPATISELFAVRVAAGSLDPVGPERVGVDAESARQRGWTIGSRLKGEFVETGYEELEVAAIIEADVPFGEPAKLFMPAGDLDRRVPLRARGDAIVFVLSDGSLEPARLRDALRRSLAGFPTLEILSREQFAASEVAVGKTFLDVVTGLLAIALGIALFGVGNTLLLTTIERTGEIGILRAIGMYRRQVAAMMSWEAVIVSVVGAAAGIALGLLAGAVLTVGVAHGSPMSPLVPWARVATTTVLCVAMAVLAAAAPSRRAARLDVLDAIRTS